MPDRRDDFDHRLADRLRAYEAGLPGREAVHPTAAPRPVRRWLPAAAVTAAAGITGVAVAIVLIGVQPPPDIGQATPTQRPTASHSPSEAPEPTPSPGVTPTATEAPSATASPTSVPTPTATPRPSGAATIAWSAGPEMSGIVNAVRHGDGRWLAGGMVMANQTTRAAVWRSDDGRSWSEPMLLAPEPTRDASGISTRYWISGFGRWDDTVLAFGWNGVGAGDGGYPMLWTSDDGGATWSVVDTAGSLYGEEYHFPDASVATPQGQLAVLSSTGLGQGAAIYLTGDLAEWEMHSITSSEEMVSVTGIAASADLLIAVGTEMHPWVDRPITTAHAWASPDGRTWQPLTPPNGNGTLASVVWDDTRGRFVAIGTDDDGLPAAWLTTDGSDWARIRLADVEGNVAAIAISDGLIVASGATGPMFEPEEGQTFAWSSYDGVTWRVVPLADGQHRPVVGAAPGFAVMIVNSWSEEHGDQWRPWAGSAGGG